MLHTNTDDNSTMLSRKVKAAKGPGTLPPLSPSQKPSEFRSPLRLVVGTLMESVQKGISEMARLGFSNLHPLHDARGGQRELQLND